MTTAASVMIIPMRGLWTLFTGHVVREIWWALFSWCKFRGPKSTYWWKPCDDFSFVRSWIECVDWNCFVAGKPWRRLRRFYLGERNNSSEDGQRHEPCLVDVVYYEKYNVMPIGVWVLVCQVYMIVGHRDVVFQAVLFWPLYTVFELRDNACTWSQLVLTLSSFIQKGKLCPLCSVELFLFIYKWIKWIKFE